MMHSFDGVLNAQPAQKVKRGRYCVAEFWGAQAASLCSPGLCERAFCHPEPQQDGEGPHLSVVDYAMKLV